MFCRDLKARENLNKIKIGLIGLGWMGREHARNIMANPRAQLAAIADCEGDQVAGFLKKHAIKCAHYPDYRQLLKSAVDAVVVATPNKTHAEICIAAARHCKHIYCEKPMAISLEDCRKVRAAVEKAGVKYLIGYHRRLNPLYQYAKKLLDEGKLGRPFMIESDYLHHVPGDLDIWSWLGKEKIAGSIFHAGSGHNVDLIRYFCGDIRSVACFKDIFLPRKDQVETEDTAAAIFRFQSGAIGKVQCCVGPILPFTFNLRLYGTKGSVLNNRVFLDTVPRFADPAHEKDCIQLPADWIPDNVQGGVSETWDKLMDHFIAMLADGAPCLNDVKSAYATSAACFAAVKSAQTNAVVELKDMD
jgi:predicted dehydrogenase